MLKTHVIRVSLHHPLGACHVPQFSSSAFLDIPEIIHLPHITHIVLLSVVACLCRHYSIKCFRCETVPNGPPATIGATSRFK